MLIDWLTLRFPLTESLGKVLHQKIMESMGYLVRFNPDGSTRWEQAVPDWDSIRSDSVGLFWSLTCDGDSVRYLTIGGSPSSQINNGVNVFGNLSLQNGAEVLIRSASIALEAILPDWRQWQCRRIDVTANYDMGNDAQVKQALRLLLATDAPRRRTNSDRKGGDTVYWNPSSQLRSGKAYHKGAHLRYQLRKGNINIDEDTLLLSDRLLRLELKLGSQFFRERCQDWRALTPDDLATQHHTFFSSLIGGGDVEITDMGQLLIELEKHAPTKGRAKAALNTWCVIRAIGFTQAKESINPNTFRNHLVLLRRSGLSSADLCAGKVLEFRRKSLILSQPVTSWDQLRRAA